MQFSKKENLIMTRALDLYQSSLANQFYNLRSSDARETIKDNIETIKTLRKLIADGSGFTKQSEAAINTDGATQLAYWL